MLALKFHKKPKPYLGKGSYLVPVFHWQRGETLFRNWRYVLSRFNRGMPNDKVHYVTLVRLPDRLPVSLNFDWTDRDPNCVPWGEKPQDDFLWVPSVESFVRSTDPDDECDLDPEEDAVSDDEDCPESEPADGDETPAVILSETSGVVSAKPARKVEPAETPGTEWGKKSYFLNDFNVGSGWMPEIVLGGVMPKENILWTKDLRLLRRGDRRQQSRVRMAKRDCRNWHAD